jgi:hypothetical protein
MPPKRLILMLLLALTLVGCATPRSYRPGFDPNRGDSTPSADDEHTKLERELSLYSD